MERPCPECGGRALCESGATSHFKPGDLSLCVRKVFEVVP